MGRVNTFDFTLGKMEAFRVNVGLEIDKEPVGGEDAENVVFYDLAVVFVRHDAVLDATGDDVGRAIWEIL